MANPVRNAPPNAIGRKWHSGYNGAKNDRLLAVQFFVSLFFRRSHASPDPKSNLIEVSNYL
jgi:hypothetical protein